MTKAGKLVCCSSGEYSGYQIEGLFVALKDFVLHDELAKYFEIRPEQVEQFKFDSNGWLNYLIQGGNLLSVEYEEIFLGHHSTAPEYGEE